MIKKYFPLILIAVLTFFVTNINYHFGDENHIEQLPFIYARQDQDYLKNDPFVAYTKEIGPRYYYSELIFHLTKYIPVEQLFYLLTYLSNLFVFLITYKVLRQFTKNPFVIYFLIIFMGFAQFGSLGQTGYINDNYLTPQLLAMPLVLGAYYFSLKNQYQQSLVFSALAIPLQPSLVLVTCVPIVGNFLLHSKTRQQIIKTIFYLFVQVALTYLFFIRHSVKFLDDDTYIYILAILRHPHHYLPSHFAPFDFIMFSLMLVALIMSLAHIHSQQKKQQLTKFINLSIILSLLLCFCGYIFSEVLPIRLIIELQAFRIIYLLRWFSFIFTFITAFDISFRLLPQKIALLIWFVFTVTIALFWPNKTMTAMPDITIKYEIDRTHLYSFVASHTNEQDLFLTPPDFGSMRIIPKRAIVVDWKSFPFNQPSMLTWYTRIQDVYGEHDQSQNYQNITDEKIKILNDKYHFDYVVLYSTTPTNQKPIFQDDNYKLIKL